MPAAEISGLDRHNTSQAQTAVSKSAFESGENIFKQNSEIKSAAQKSHDKNTTIFEKGCHFPIYREIEKEYVIPGTCVVALQDDHPF